MEDCTITTEIIDGIHHTYYSRDGVIVAECRRSTEYGRDIERWYHDGKQHRDDAPAEIHYKNGQIISEYWYSDDKLHRDDGPAEILYKNGQKFAEYWYRDGKKHRDDGPAEIHYNYDQITEEIWYRDGKLYTNGQLAAVVYQNFDPVKFYWTGMKYTQHMDEFRDTVKGDAIHDPLRPLPIPICDAIALYYCYQ